jgi:catechol 2,3-dioxygenase-like lactoylglutathione lyase family enzyme
MDARALDHVALWVADRDALADFLCGGLGMHVIERTDAFTLVGADARRGKLTLFAAEGPREPGALGRVVLRVSDVDRALAALPSGTAVERRDGLALFEGPERLGLGLTNSRPDGAEYDLDHVVLRVRDPASSFDALSGLGFEPDDGRLQVGDKSVLLERGDGAEPERPLLNHLALLVDSARRPLEEARTRGLEIADVVDAANTYAVFVWGPDRIKLEYVEHKPGFSLA